MTITQKIKTKALSLGFDVVGITSARPLEKDFHFFKWWLDKGYAADIQYMYKKQERRENPHHILEEVQSIICCGMNYYTKPSQQKISNYAWGDDYHDILLEKLKQLSNFMKEELSLNIQTKEYVDTGAILERSYAAQAGLGWIGKNTCLINKEKGSYLFLGEILTDLTLDYDKPVLDHCGTCTACLDACPTQAFPRPGVLDSTKCISYWTLEYKGENFPKEVEKKIGNHIVGCDICQDVCPWNSKVKVSKETSFYPRKDFNNPPLETWQYMTESDFRENFRKSPLKRLKLKGLMRNIKNALRNQHEHRK
ncbi:MAG: tRNA epoxyqueuosine(34) reductase QueG [Deltaproteobacteria bacterium]|nr:tRNA epoxyqueuosine(34) reductase QueG [Deltaproteobacteria bacterium]